MAIDLDLAYFACDTMEHPAVLTLPHLTWLAVSLLATICMMTFVVIYLHLVTSSSCSASCGHRLNIDAEDGDQFPRCHLYTQPCHISQHIYFRGEEGGGVQGVLPRIVHNETKGMKPLGEPQMFMFPDTLNFFRKYVRQRTSGALKLPQPRALQQ